MGVYGSACQCKQIDCMHGKRLFIRRLPWLSKLYWTDWDIQSRKVWNGLKVDSRWVSSKPALDRQPRMDLLGSYVPAWRQTPQGKVHSTEGSGAAVVNSINSSRSSTVDSRSFNRISLISWISKEQKEIANRNRNYNKKGWWENEYCYLICASRSLR